jgi:hypothetical protein
MRSKLTYANVTASLALFVALGGVSWAAVTLPAHSVGTRELKGSAVTSGKIANGAVRRVDLATDALPQQGPAGPAGATGATGARGPAGPTGATGPQGPAACDQTRLLLCTNADLPANDLASLTIDGFEILSTRTYRVDCAPASNPDCTLSFAGADPVALEIDAWYAAAAAGNPTAVRDATLTILHNGVPSRRFFVIDAEPTALFHQAGRYQLNLRATSVQRIAT